ncbi:AarF/ABC1/UbiB kinase family protein [Halalkalibacterium halodurans]|uniref:ABC1 kinase family protein n=1 Tax=Halalkalibacterium halodurans TaxID=86665 RepID=UPI0005A0D8D6|nr:AarF/ABC1/UbiB kinase family protein [Halalkalibacterium halodurans]MED4173956.1 AarF/ABC1/UbiB kinase family protein [Halalkalibacterium halodurans]
MFERRIRHLKRYREIVTAFSHNGFGFIVKELGLHKIISMPKRLLVKEQNVQTKTTGERLRLFLEELGPTFVKMGQMASTRPDLIPSELMEELEKLQDRVSPFSYEEVKAIVEHELGMAVDELFREFHETPLGAASIGQVHFAVLQSGEPVAVKVQRPNIEEIIKTDLEILQHLAEIAEHRLEWAANYQLVEIIEEFSKALLAELDYTVEGRNADRLAKLFEDDPTVQIPQVYWDYSTKKVLTMEYVEGTKLNEREELKQRGYDEKMLAQRITHAILKQILLEGFFHGDPHPGNISALPSEAIAFMDFGMVGRLSPQMKQHFASLVIAIMRRRSEGVLNAITKMGIVPDDVDMQLLQWDIDELREKFDDVPLSQVSLGEAVNDLFAIANRHRIQIPADLTLLGKTLLTMEQMVEKLDPELSIVKVAEPFGRQLLKERLSPKSVAEHVYNQWNEYGDVLTELPRTLKELTAITRKGKLPLELSLPKIERFLNKLDRISNRLSFSIVLLSFSIIMVGLIIGSALGGQSSLLWNIPAVEIGFVVALLMFIWLLYSILRSGRF